MAFELTPEEITKARRDFIAGPADDRFAEILANRQAKEAANQAGFSNPAGQYSVSDPIEIPADKPRVMESERLAALEEVSMGFGGRGYQESVEQTLDQSSRVGDPMLGAQNLVSGLGMLHADRVDHLTQELSTAQQLAREETADEQVLIAQARTQATDLEAQLSTAGKTIATLQGEQKTLLAGLAETYNPTLVAMLSNDASRGALVANLEVFDELKSGSEARESMIAGAQQEIQAMDDPKNLLASNFKSKEDLQKDLDKMIADQDRLRLSEKALQQAGMLQVDQPNMLVMPGSENTLDAEWLLADLEPYQEKEAAINKATEDRVKTLEKLESTQTLIATNENQIRAVEQKHLAPIEEKIVDEQAAYQDTTSRISRSRGNNELTAMVEHVQKQIAGNDGHSLSARDNNANEALSNAYQQTLMAGGDAKDFLNYARQSNDLKAFVPVKVGAEMSTKAGLIVHISEGRNGEAVAKVYDRNHPGDAQTFAVGSNGLDLTAISDSTRIAIRVDENMEGRDKVNILLDKDQAPRFEVRKGLGNPNDAINLVAATGSQQMELAIAASDADKQKIGQENRQMQRLAKSMGIEVEGGVELDRGVKHVTTQRPTRSGSRMIEETTRVRTGERESEYHHHEQLVKALEKSGVNLAALGVGGNQHASMASIGVMTPAATEVDQAQAAASSQGSARG